MSLRPRKKPPAVSLANAVAEIEISIADHNGALHCLAHHPLSEDERVQLTEVVHGYTGPCDVVAAREGLAWLRERYRDGGQTPPFRDSTTATEQKDSFIRRHETALLVGCFLIGAVSAVAWWHLF